MFFLASGVAVIILNSKLALEVLGKMENFLPGYIYIYDSEKRLWKIQVERVKAEL